MVREIVVRQMGGSVGATLPREMAERLKLEAGSRVLAIETEDGILLKPFNEDFARTMKAYEEVAKEYRNALRELA
jgi:antitoxin MazE